VSADTAARLKWRQVLAWRMARHHLIQRSGLTDLVQVTADLGGLHAQVMSSAELSLWARMENVSREAVREALWTHRSLVKLWAARGTLHLLPSAELGTWLAALGTMTKFRNTGHPEIDTLAAAVGQALDGQMLTREELAREVGRITGSAEYSDWIRVSWGSYLKAASFRGLVCFAPSEGTQVRFTLPATWVPGGLHTPSPAVALREITRRFLRGYGPASAEDLTRWWLGPARPRRGRELIAALGDEVTKVTVDGRPTWAVAGDVAQMAAATSGNVARLLPAFDPWVIGMARHPPMVTPQDQARVFRPQGWTSPVMLVNGQVHGIWRHTRKGRTLAVELEPFRKLPHWAAGQLEAESQRLAVFLKCDRAQIRTAGL
jgi:winged helix DNA-binding protein